MDIFKFSEAINFTQLSQGEIINGLTSKTWIERYDKFGEFKLVGPANIGLREKLPLYTFISHTDTKQIMIVENHEISQSKTKEPILTITGRDFNSFMEYRNSVIYQSFPISTGVQNYESMSGLTSGVTKEIIRRSTDSVYLPDDFDAIWYTTIVDWSAGMPGTQPTLPTRKILEGNLWEEISKLLTYAGLGIKIVRPGPWKTPSVGALYNEILIHGGLDKSKTVIFSAASGDIESADYLWSIKNSYSIGLGIGRWVGQRAAPLSNYAGRYYRTRFLYVDGNAIDGTLATAPTGAPLTQYITDMEELGLGSLGAHKDIQIAKLEISSDVNRWKYRQDYDIGDLVTVLGDYDITQKMQVTEYVEIEDENGQRGYPTLIIPNTGVA